MTTIAKRKVVVQVELSLMRHSERNIVAARFEKLGLTAYGHTESEATLNLKKLFHNFIHLYRETGQIESRLDQVGVTWHWADDHSPELPPYEDTNDLFAKSWSDISKKHEDAHGYTLMAA